MWKIRKIVHKGEYDYAVVPEHPNAIRFGYVLAHRIILENYLGRMLEDEEVPHHIDEDKKNNKIENIELCLKRVHSRYHQLKRGRTFLLITCGWCGKVFDREKRKAIKNKGRAYYCRISCAGKARYNGERYDNNVKEFIKTV